MMLSKKKSDLRQCECGGKREHLGYRTYKIQSSLGEIDTNRLYCGCVLCRMKAHPMDELLGIDGHYTVGLRDLAVYAAVDSSFSKAQKRLEKFCGISVAENTIKMLCDKKAVKMENWQKTDPTSTQDFQASYGELEFTTDGTMVNTLHGWREVRIGIFSLREFGPSALPSEWDTRKLPRPHACIAFAAMEEKDVSVAVGGLGQIG